VGSAHGISQKSRARTVAEITRWANGHEKNALNVRFSDMADFNPLARSFLLYNIPGYGQDSRASVVISQQISHPSRLYAKRAADGNVREPCEAGDEYRVMAMSRDLGDHPVSRLPSIRLAQGPTEWCKKLEASSAILSLQVHSSVITSWFTN
jgi:hypothetical protein